MSIQIKELTAEAKQPYFCCLEEWSDEMKESGNHRQKWYEQIKAKGLGVKLAYNDQGQLAGMIQYAPIELTGVAGNDLFFVYCIWVHGHKKGIGDQRGHGLGKALLQAAEEDVKQRGAKGLAAWGLGLPFWMKASWFKKHGYKKVDREGMVLLLWKPFSPDAKPPKWIKSKQTPKLYPDKVTITAIKNGWCSSGNITYERAKRAAGSFGDKVIWQEIDNTKPEMQQVSGFGDRIFIQDKCITTGPPLNYEKIKKQIEKALKKHK